VLEARGFLVEPAVRARIDRERDRDVLTRWTREAATATDLDAIHW
jgi:hypothetical protein